MQLIEGAKISQQILRQAINDPNFTFGIEAEFHLKGAAAFMRQQMTQGLETMNHQDSEYFVKKLGDVDWHDVTHFFRPLAVDHGDMARPSAIIQHRLENLYDAFERGTGSAEGNTVTDAMWPELKERNGIHVLMAALRIYPEGRVVGLPESQEKALRDIIYDGDTEEIKPFGKLRDVPIATAPAVDDDELGFYNMFRDETVSAFYSLVAKDLSAKLGTEVKYVFNDHLVYHVGGYHSWVVTSDSSLVEEMEDGFEKGIDIAGVEVVSSIMNAEEGLTMLNKMLEIMNGEILGLEVITTEETGLHVNLGVKDKEIDPIKILVLAGDEHIVNKFDRANNKYAASVQTAMKDRMSTVASGNVPRGLDASLVGTRKDVNSLVAQAQEVLRGLETDERDIDRVIAVLNDIKPEGKSHSINFEKLRSGYVEYRAIGNRGYEKRKSEIMDTVLHMIGITHIATDPSAYRKEFLKKLYLMVQRTVATANEPITASVGMIGYGARGGYGAPIANEPKTPYDGEEFLTKYGFDPGSDTQ